MQVVFDFRNTNFSAECYIYRHPDPLSKFVVDSYNMAANKPAAASPSPVPTYCLVARPEALDGVPVEEADEPAEEVIVALEELVPEPAVKEAHS